MVPFDTYTFTSSVLVVEKATNKSVPIVAFRAGETPAADNFIIASGSGYPTRNNFTYNDGTGPITVEVESRCVTFTAQRSQFAKTITLGLLLINWALTVGSTYITLFVVFGSGLDPATVLLPISIVIVAIPTLRSLYVGSPPFGIYLGKSWSRALKS